MVKVLALYLPQFHAIPENNEWWGEGFTEWNVVQSAKKISKYTNQPRVPLMGYYDLSNADIIRSQAKMAKEYGVDGFVIYSYYSNGQTLLEKPAELLLKNKDIDISFCFSWANHDWMRTWFSYNREMLRKQEYATTAEEIEEHFCYLLPFFKDSRYIKINNNPVLCIYDYEAIQNFSEYRRIWNSLAQKEGFDGIYFMQTLGGRHLEWNKEMFEGCFDFEPTYTTFLNMEKEHFINRFKRGIKKVFKGTWITNYFDYSKVCEEMEKREETDQNHSLGAFAEWDNTPRHSHNGTIFKRFSIERFEKCLEIQMSKSIKYNKPFLIIDAWNEWGEGAMLEPDNVWGTQKLESISRVRNKIKGKVN